VVSCASLIPPAPLPIDAPLELFSAARALLHVKSVASAPRPMGSQGHARALAYLVDALDRLGLASEVQTRTVVGDGGAALVHNVLGHFGDPKAQRRILLVAHYDSVATGPGAADDGAGVAVLLEAARALRTQRPPRGCRIDLLFTDGEEIGLYGARAFEVEPGTVVVNLEARGSRGLAHMFETSERNGWLVRRFATLPRPEGSSFDGEVYRRLPNDTDFTALKVHAAGGFNFAFIDGLLNYHSANDDLQHLSERTLQHLGDAVLALTRELSANDDWAVAAETDRVYFSVLGRFVVHYSTNAALLLAASSLLLTLFAIARFLRHHRRAGLRALATGIGLCGCSLLAAAGLGWLLPWAAKRVSDGWARGLAEHDRTQFAATAALVFVSTYIFAHRLRRPMPDVLATSALVILTATAVATTLVAPGASFLFAWPALGVGFALMLESRPEGGLRLAATAAAIVPTLALFVPLSWKIMAALGSSNTAVMAVLLALAFFVTQPPCALPTSRWLWGSTAMVAGLCLVGAAVWQTPPRALPESVGHVIDHCSGSAFLLRAAPPNDGQRSAATSLSAPTASSSARYFPDLDDPIAVAMAASTAPHTSVSHATWSSQGIAIAVPEDEDLGWLDFRFEDGNAHLIAAVNGVPVGQRLDRFRFWAPKGQIVLAFDPASSSRAAVRISSFGFGLPSGLAAPEPRRRTIGAAPFDQGDFHMSIDCVASPAATAHRD
jgi:hypothetical protein